MGTQDREVTLKSQVASVKGGGDRRNILGAFVECYGVLQRGFPNAHNKLRLHFLKLPVSTGCT